MARPGPVGATLGGMNAHTASTQELWLVRHGETEWSRDGRHTSTTDLPLTETASRSPRELAPRLADVDFDLVLTSPRQRARATAELVGHAEAEVDDDLVEWAYGDYEGVTTAEIRETVPGLDASGPTRSRAARPPTRCDAARPGGRAGPRAAEGRTLVFGHGHALRALTARWLGLPVDRRPAVPPRHRTCRCSATSGRRR